VKKLKKDGKIRFMGFSTHRNEAAVINAAAALKWVLSNPDIHTAIPGMTAFDQLDLNVKILSDITLTDEEKKDLVVPIAETGLYCTGCSKCISACPLNLPVPDLMRAYMYVYGYSSPAMARSLLCELGTTDNPCRECNT
jgi:predicted aldo/keto reductase-like oxidoreductase